MAVNFFDEDPKPNNQEDKEQVVAKAGIEKTLPDSSSGANELNALLAIRYESQSEEKLNPYEIVWSTDQGSSNLRSVLEDARNKFLASNESIATKKVCTNYRAFEDNSYGSNGNVYGESVIKSLYTPSGLPACIEVVPLPVDLVSRYEAGERIVQQMTLESCLKAVGRNGCEQQSVMEYISQYATSLEQSFRTPSRPWCVACGVIFSIPGTDSIFMHMEFDYSANDGKLWKFAGWSLPHTDCITMSFPYALYQARRAYEKRINMLASYMNKKPG